MPMPLKPEETIIKGKWREEKADENASFWFFQNILSSLLFYNIGFTLAHKLKQ